MRSVLLLFLFSFFPCASTRLDTLDTMDLVLPGMTLGQTVRIISSSDAVSQSILHLLIISIPSLPFPPPTLSFFFLSLMTLLMALLFVRAMKM